MEQPNHSIESLFDQLGLDSSDDAIDIFIRKNKPLPDDVLLHDAVFWTSSQSRCLQQMKDEDADWAAIVDQLDVMLR
tara:strand:- start:1166 stop:1396 length:231 start_codon:yes stop_codon:yes gene_type:complete